MFKKVLALILVISVSFTFTSVFAQENVDVYNKENIELLNWLGIVFPKGEEQYNSDVNRADFAVYLARALGIDDTTDPGDVRYFIDMPMYDYATYSVNCLVEKGILSVNEEKLFYPSRPITYQEVMKMVVCALGYKPVADAKGGYPNGYTFVANKLGISDGVSRSSGHKFTLNDTISVLSEMLCVPLYEIDMVKLDNDDVMLSYRASEDNTLFYTSFGYRYNSGILTGYDGMNISFDVMASEGRAVVGNVFYRVKDGIDLTAFLGRNISILTDEDGYIVYAYQKSGREKVTNIDVSDFIEYDSDRKIIYNYGENATREINVSSAVVLYNGAVPSSGISEILNNFESGYITVIDSDNNGINDVVIVNDYKAYVVKSVNDTRNIIYSKIEGQNPIELNYYSKAEIVDKAGNEMLISELENDSVLNVMATKNNDRIKIIVTDSTVSGKVEKTHSGERFSFRVDGGNYFVNKAHSTIKNEIKVGQNYTFLLNMFGEAVMAVEGLRENYKAGYLCGLTIDGTFDDVLKLRIFTKDEGMKVFETTAKPRIDGVKVSGAVSAANAIPDVICDMDDVIELRTQMILFKVDSNGIITDIDTYNVSSAEDEELTLSRVTDGETPYEKLEGRVARHLPVNGNTDFYSVPQDSSSDDMSDYKVVKQTAFNRSIKFKFECYKSKGKNEFVDLVIYRMNPNDTAENAWLNSNMFLVGEKLQSADKEGNLFITISGLMQAGNHSIDVYEEKLLETSVSVADIEQGDLVRYRKDETGKVIEIQKLYDAQDNLKVNWRGDSLSESLFESAYNSNFQLTFGYVNKKGDSTVSWGYKSGDMIDESMDLSATKCMFYDRTLPEEKRIYTGSVNEIADYETAEDNCDIIIVQLVQTMIKSVVVYKR